MLAAWPFEILLCHGGMQRRIPPKSQKPDRQPHLHYDVYRRVVLLDADVDSNASYCGRWDAMLRRGWEYCDLAILALSDALLFCVLDLSPAESHRPFLAVIN